MSPRCAPNSVLLGTWSCSFVECAMCCAVSLDERLVSLVEVWKGIYAMGSDSHSDSYSKDLVPHPYKICLVEES